MTITDTITPPVATYDAASRYRMEDTLPGKLFAVDVLPHCRLASVTQEELLRAIQQALNPLGLSPLQRCIRSVYADYPKGFAATAAAELANEPMVTSLFPER